MSKKRNRQQYRLYCEQKNIPIISPNTETFLSKVLKKYKPKVCLEIGSAIWYSTSSIAEKISKWGGKLYSFEISYPAYLEWLETIHNLKEQNTKLYPFNFLNIDTQKMIPYTEKIDFVFVDAHKSKYWDYMMKIRNLLETSAIIVIDDVIKYHHKISWLYDFLNKKQIDYEILQLDEDDGVILIKK